MDSADPTFFSHPVIVPLEVVYPEMKSVSEGDSGDSEEDLDNLSISHFITSRSGGTFTKESVPKRPSTRKQKKVALDSALKENKEKKKRRRLLKSRLIDEEDVPPADIVEVENEKMVQEPIPLVRKTSKKAVSVKQKKVLSTKDAEVDGEGEVEKEKIVEKKKPLRKRPSSSEEPASSKRERVELSELERRANLKKQKVLWGRVFDSETLD
ncbi:uncharacterized protein [Nicotiana tomentosiformis]|uniref:uncharacterized protein n=1 Tax=Nicotiana tomentosiformis TaxID=4098 RepID=UPI00388C8BE0